MLLATATDRGVAGGAAAIDHLRSREEGDAGGKAVLELDAARDLNAQAVSALVQQMVPKALWENQCADPASDCSYFIGPVSWSENPDDWEAARSQLAHIIDGQ